MGMQQKLDKAFQAGFVEGQKIANEHAEVRGQIRGASETWDIMENMFTEINGIGPKTKVKILRKIKEYANKEKSKWSVSLNEPSGRE